MRAEDFMIAFTLEDYNTLETKSDTRYVKFFAEYSNNTNGQRERFEVGLHPCTEKDYERFYPVETRSKSLLESYKEEPNRGLYCIDDDSIDLILFGSYTVKTFGALSFNALPCNHRLTHLGGKDDRIDPNCVADLQK